MENFFETQQPECFYLYSLGSLSELKLVIEGYAHDDNHERISLKLKGLSPE